MRTASLSALLMLASSTARAADAPSAWTTFLEPRRNTCIGPAGSFDPPLEIEVRGHRYRIEGHRMVQLDKDPDQRIAIGVISAIKDDRPETLEAITKAIKRLTDKKIDVLVAN